MVTAKAEDCRAVTMQQALLRRNDGGNEGRRADTEVEGKDG